MKKRLPITSEVLKWARESAGYHSIESLTKLFPKLSDWEQGLSFPTYRQLEQLAKKYKRPTAIFFFPEPPKEAPIEKSLRSSEDDLYNLSPTIRFLYRKAKAFQIYLQELLSEEYTNQLQKLDWLKLESRTSIENIANNIRKRLGISLDKQSHWKNTAQAVEQWRELLAQNGIYVFKNAFFNQKISGFCIYDEVFPIIFINNSHHESRQIFTIFHELAHLIFKQNYLDSYENFWKLKQTPDSNIEAKCNIFASHFLVPEKDFLMKLPTKIDEIGIRNLADFYKVSKEVILKKLLDSNKISLNLYEKQIKEWRNLYGIKKSKSKNSGNYYNTRLAYLGKPYFSLVLEKYYQEKISIETASEYLDIKMKSFPKLEETFLNKEVSNVRL